MMMMMNVLFLCLLFTSVANAGFFTPSPVKHNPKDDVIVKEGQTGVKIEFEKDDGNTKVLISPPDDVTTAKEKIEEAYSSVKKEGDSAHQEEVKEESHHGFRPRELVCDAYGKCKHKIASYVEKTKDTVAEKAHEAAEEAKETVSEAFGKVQDTVTSTAHKASDKAHEMKESVKDAASEVSTKAKDKVGGKASEMKEGAKEQAERAKEQVYDATIDTTKKAKEGKKEVKGIFRRAGEVFKYMVPPVRMASVGGVLHLLGFAVAYGTSVWVTFASSYVLAGALARHQFGMVQSKIYPVYFKAMASSVGMALLGHLMGHRLRFSPLSLNLLASFLMTLANLMYLEPRATKVMFERMKKEKEEGVEKEGHASEPSGKVVDSGNETAAAAAASRGTTTEGVATQEKREGAAGAKRRIMRSSEILLRRLNSYSSLLNVLTLMSLTWHLVNLGQHLNTIC